MSPSGGRRWPGRLTSRPPRMGRACKPRPLSPVGHPPAVGRPHPTGARPGSQVHRPREGGTQPQTDTDALPGSPACRCGHSGNVTPPQGPHEPAALGFQAWALTVRFLDCVPLGPFLRTACLSPFKPPNRDPQAVACEQQTLTSRLRRPRVRGQPRRALARVSSQRPGSSTHLLDTRPGSLQWPRSKISEAGGWTLLRGG